MPSRNRLGKQRGQLVHPGEHGLLIVQAEAERCPLVTIKATGRGQLPVGGEALLVHRPVAIDVAEERAGVEKVVLLLDETVGADDEP